LLVNSEIYGKPDPESAITVGKDGQARPYTGHASTDYNPTAASLTQPSGDAGLFAQMSDHAMKHVATGEPQSVLDALAR